MSRKTHGFYKTAEARKKAPVISRPDLVRERNATIEQKRVLGRPLKPADGTDPRVRCYRPDGTCYAILSPAQWADLRKRRKLAGWLAQERESGIVLDVAYPEYDHSPLAVSGSPEYHSRRHPLADTLLNRRAVA